MPEKLALLTDFYELTMMQGYVLTRPGEEGIFDLFFRRQPFGGGFTVFAGLEPLIQALQNLRFTPEDLDYLASLKVFRKEFLDYLTGFRFSGDLYAFPEGSLVFPNEPLLRVQGPIAEGQYLESLALNLVNFQSLIATKAARVRLAARAGTVLEFGLRRAHGPDGAVSAARAAYIGGTGATSNLLAGRQLGIPVGGTMAHSWVLSFPSELAAFRRYAELYPDPCVLLVDTYDTLRSGVPNAVRVFRELKAKGFSRFGIRLDSGDLEYLSKEARKMLDSGGVAEAKIYASNELDEWIIQQILENGAPVDAFGVGSKLVTGSPDPFLTGVFKLSARRDGAGYKPCMKVSNHPDKTTLPGIKNVYRFCDRDGGILGDLIYLEEEEEELAGRIERREPIRFNHPTLEGVHIVLRDYTRAQRMLEPVVLDGNPVRPSPLLPEIRGKAKQGLERLHPTYKRLLNPHVYKVSLSDRLKALKKDLAEKLGKRVNEDTGDLS
jgi:nicotinate phosphoribosyltransferase